MFNIYTEVSVGFTGYVQGQLMIIKEMLSVVEHEKNN
jgi:hypothetical protein